MKKKTPLIFLLATLSAAAIGAVGCGDKTDDGKPEHVHSYTEWKYDETKHWKECPDDHAKDASTEGAHKDADNNSRCDDCGYVIPAQGHTHSYTEWKYDETKHWKECPDDQAKDASTEAAHVDANKDGKCDANCGYEFAHQHSYTEWKYDEEKHWKECPDDHEKDATSEGPHVDADKDGECDDCGYEVGVGADNKVSFVIDVADYEGEGVADKTIKTGGSFTFPEAPSIDYYEFDYWKLGENHYAVGDSYKIEEDGDLTFTAVYAETYVLTYSVAEGLTAPPQATGRVGAEIELAEGVDNGYSVFANWVIGGQNYASGAKFTPVHGANVATAAYTDTYAVKFVVDDGLTAPEAKSGVVGSEIELPEAPEKADYEFEGWLIGETLYQAGDKYEPALGETTATAQYALAYVYVTFEKAEGVEGDLPAQAVRVKINTELEEDDIPELTVAEFHAVVWYNGEDVVTELKFNENVTITAKSEYVGTNADAFVFVEVTEGEDDEEEVVAYTVMAGDNFADYVTNGRLGLPVSHEGKPVIGVAAGTSSEYAFGNSAAAGLTYVYIPASYTSIGNYAFCQNSTLATVIYGEDSQLKTVGAYSFYYCQALSTISDSTDKTGFHFPASVKTIGNGAFQGVSYGTREVNIYFDEENGVLESIGNSAFRSDGMTVQKLSGFVINTAFPSTLKTIGEYAFHCNPIIGRVDFGENATLTTIGAYAFGQHTLTSNAVVYTLTELVIPKTVTSIGIHAFQNNQVLEYVEFEEGSPITVLPEHIFNMCYSLGEIILPAGLTTIESNAFSSCFSKVNNGNGMNLNGSDPEFNLAIPAGVTSYDASVFSNSVFDTITVPANYTSIAASAFSGCVFREIIFEETAAGADVVPLTIGSLAFSSDKAFPMDITIPARVTSIGARAFWKVDLKSLAFEAGSLDLTIEDYAFNAFNADAGKDSLSAGTTAANILYSFSATSVELPARLVKLGAGAFQGQFKLQNVTFANGIKITEIPDYAFAHCFGLQNVNVPAGIKTIGKSAYSIYAVGLTGTTASTRLTANFYDGTLNASGTAVATAYQISATDFYDISSIDIPASVTAIKSNAYYNRGLTISSLTFKGEAANEDLTIEDGAFGVLNTHVNTLKGSSYTNTGLTSLTLPANLVEIGGAFRYNSYCYYAGLKSLSFATGSRINKLGNFFMAYSYVTSFEVPASVEEIGNSVFLSADLASLTFAEGSTLKKIGDEAFSNTMPANGVVTAANQRMKITSVTIPASVEKIGIKPFAGIDTLTAINVAEGNANYESDNGVLYSKAKAAQGEETEGVEAKLVMYPFGKTDTSYTVKAGVKTIADHAFTGNKHLTSIDFKDVKVLEGERAFMNVKLTAIEHTFESVGNYAFAASAVANSTLLTANINITGETLPTYLFQNCATLQTATLGSGFTSIPNYTFSSCSVLENLTINATVTTIGSTAFSGCKKLTFANIDFSSVTSIDGNAFQNCNELANITLGAIDNIPTNAFANTKITSLTLTNTSMVTIFASAGSSADTTAFTGLTGLTIYVPENLVSTYLADTNWQLAMTKGHVSQIVAIPADDAGVQA